jgi:hypothetical protein
VSCDQDTKLDEYAQLVRAVQHKRSCVDDVDTKLQGRMPAVLPSTLSTLYIYIYIYASGQGQAGLLPADPVPLLRSSVQPLRPGSQRARRVKWASCSDGCTEMTRLTGKIHDWCGFSYHPHRDSYLKFNADTRVRGTRTSEFILTTSKQTWLARRLSPRYRLGEVLTPSSLPLRCASMSGYMYGVNGTKVVNEQFSGCVRVPPPP